MNWQLDANKKIANLVDAWTQCDHCRKWRKGVDGWFAFSRLFAEADSLNQSNADSLITGTPDGKFWCGQLPGLNCDVAEEAYRPEYAFPSSTQVEASGRKWSIEDCKTCIKNLIWKIPRHAMRGPNLQERISSVDKCPSIQQVVCDFIVHSQDSLGPQCQ